MNPVWTNVRGHARSPVCHFYTVSCKEEAKLDPCVLFLFLSLGCVLSVCMCVQYYRGNGSRLLSAILKPMPVAFLGRAFWLHWLTPACLPVAVDMGCAEGKAVVEKGGVNHGTILCPFQQVSEVAEMSVTPSDSVAGTVFI